jgi:hypothetical protein
MQTVELLLPPSRTWSACLLNRTENYARAKEHVNGVCTFVSVKEMRQDAERQLEWATIENWSYHFADMNPFLWKQIHQNPQ